jgi:hypothetical protein
MNTLVKALGVLVALAAMAMLVSWLAGLFDRHAETTTDAVIVSCGEGTVRRGDTCIGITPPPPSTTRVAGAAAGYGGRRESVAEPQRRPRRPPLTGEFAVRPDNGQKVYCRPGYVAKLEWRGPRWRIQCYPRGSMVQRQP